MEIIGRKDIRELLDSKFTLAEQGELYNMFKGIMVDELLFVMEIKEQEIKNRAKLSNFTNPIKNDGINYLH